MVPTTTQVVQVVHSINMLNIPDNFPSRASNEEVLRVIKEVHDEIANSGFNVDKVLQLSPIIQVGQSELQTRFMNKSAETSDKLAKIAVGIAVLSLVISGTTIYISVLLNNEDNTVRNEQLQVLEEIKTNLELDK